MKTCSKCGLVKDESEFWKDNSRRDKLYCWCKSCLREYRQTEAGKESHSRGDKKYSQTKKGKEFRRKHDAEYRKANPEKIKARNAVNSALRDGRLFKEPCHCGETNVQGHHEDYSKPLDVEWLCNKHHID